MSRVVSAEGRHLSRASRAVVSATAAASGSFSISARRGPERRAPADPVGLDGGVERVLGVVEEGEELGRVVPVGGEQPPQRSPEVTRGSYGDRAGRTRRHASLQFVDGPRRGPGLPVAPCQRSRLPRAGHAPAPARTTLVGCLGRLRRGSPISAQRVPSPNQRSAAQLPPRREPATPSRVLPPRWPPSGRVTPMPRWSRWRTPSRGRYRPRWTAWPTATPW